MSEHQALPVAGYRPQTHHAVDVVNENKELEERCIRRIEQLMGGEANDKRWLAIGKTHMEQAWMAVNRAVFKPGRVSLPEDKE